MYDAIVVGARCAGSPTAMLLARQGHKVLLVDRDKFPSDIMSTHYIHLPGKVRLSRWGLLDKVMATGCPPIPRNHLHMGEMEVVPPAPPLPYGLDSTGALPPPLHPRQHPLSTPPSRPAPSSATDSPCAS